MKKRGRPKGMIDTLYTVYDNRTDMPVIIDGTAEEAARAMGIVPASFRGIVSRTWSGYNKRWYVEARSIKKKKHAKVGGPYG